MCGPGAPGRRVPSDERLRYVHRRRRRTGGLRHRHHHVQPGRQSICVQGDKTSSSTTLTVNGKPSARSIKPLRSRSWLQASMRRPLRSPSQRACRAILGRRPSPPRRSSSSCVPSSERRRLSSVKGKPRRRGAPSKSGGRDMRALASVICRGRLCLQDLVMKRSALNPRRRVRTPKACPGCLLCAQPGQFRPPHVTASVNSIAPRWRLYVP